MGVMYNEYCMKFRNVEIKENFYNKFSKEIQSKIICIAEDGAKFDFESDRKIETVAFDEEEKIAIMFLGYQTYNYYKPHIFIINVENGHVDKQSQTFENITIHY